MFHFAWESVRWVTTQLVFILSFLLCCKYHNKLKSFIFKCFCFRSFYWYIFLYLALFWVFMYVILGSCGIVLPIHKFVSKISYFTLPLSTSELWLFFFSFYQKYTSFVWWKLKKIFVSIVVAAVFLFFVLHLVVPLLVWNYVKFFWRCKFFHMYVCVCVPEKWSIFESRVERCCNLQQVIVITMIMTLIVIFSPFALQSCTKQKYLCIYLSGKWQGKGEFCMDGNRRKNLNKAKLVSSFANLLCDIHCLKSFGNK